MTEQEMRKRLTQLKVEHRDLDAAIAALSETGSGDQLQIARLKKRKLALKDQIALLEDYLTPDIIA
ncbi:MULTISPECIES: YdcH family protein [Alteraurantiacibacter]|uniref:YdcH family protein n=2 Tax=Alteraurantiacibacter TaxID=2800678 RepID=A0ABV7EEY5_9SPHN